MTDSMIQWATEFLQEHGMWTLALFSYTEAIFHPIPVDPVLVALSALDSWNTTSIFIVATLSSILGGATAYWLGGKLGKPVFINFFGADMFAKGKKFLEHWGMLSVILAAATPIPFKVMAWTAGILHMPFWKFFIAQTIGRALRFAAVLWLFEIVKHSAWYQNLF